VFHPQQYLLGACEAMSELPEGCQVTASIPVPSAVFR
jgi:hypothetical protein